MEALRELLHETIDLYGLGSIEALKASQEMDKHIEVAQRQRALTKEEFMTRYLNDMAKKKRAAKVNEADLYTWDKGRMVGRKAVKHKQRQPYWRAK